MTDKPENPIAFPVPPAQWRNHGDLSLPEPGMTLLDYFAGQALPWALGRDYGGDWGEAGKEHAPRAAKRAYNIAEAMLAERERRMKP